MALVSWASDLSWLGSLRISCVGISELQVLCTNICQSSCSWPRSPRGFLLVLLPVNGQLGQRLENLEMVIILGPLVEV